MKCKCVSIFLSGYFSPLNRRSRVLSYLNTMSKSQIQKYLCIYNIIKLKAFKYLYFVSETKCFFWRLFNYYTICIIVLTTQVSVSHQKQVYYNGLLCISLVHTAHTWQYFVVINSEVGCFSPWGLIIGHCNLESRVARLGECFVGFVD